MRGRIIYRDECGNVIASIIIENIDTVNMSALERDVFPIMCKALPSLCTSEVYNGEEEDNPEETGGGEFICSSGDNSKSENDEGWVCQQE